MCLFYSTGYAQEKRDLKTEDYSLWDSPETIRKASVSNNGEWVSYTIGYANGSFGLNLKNLLTGASFNYNLKSFNYNEASFSPDNTLFTCIDGDSLKSINLKLGKNESIINRDGFSFSHEGRFLLSFRKNDKYKTIWLNDRHSSTALMLNNVLEFSLSPDLKKLAVISIENGTNIVTVYFLNKKMISKRLSSNGNYESITWNSNGNTIAFFNRNFNANNRPRSNEVYFYKDLDRNPFLRVLKEDAFPVQEAFEFGKMAISNDGNRLLVQVKDHDYTVIAKNRIEQKSLPQVWASTDNNIPQKLSLYPLPYQAFVWSVDQGTLQSLKDKQHPEFIFAQDLKFAFVYNTSDYLPAYKYLDNYIDLYIKDLSNGKKKLIVEKISLESEKVRTSFTGRYLAYFKDKHWWIYDTSKGTKSNVTAGLETEFGDLEDDYHGALPSFGSPGFFNDDSALIVYDKYDIWLISPDGTKREKITNGRSAKIIYRLSDTEPNISTINFAPKYNTKSYNATTGFIVRMLHEDSLDEGFSYWNQREGSQFLVSKGLKMYPLSRLNAKKIFLFQESGYNIPPRLGVLLAGKERILFETNSFEKNFNMGKQELIQYKINDGKILKGVLFYPANFDSNKKYPMIVNIYQKQSKYLHEYVIPSERTMAGINPVNFSADGYFILYPDISYSLEYPGESALKCILAAVEKVVGMGFIDQENIGLTGHSFGGYETAFIIGQTNLFKTAIAGAGISDLRDHYLSISPSFGINMKKFEGAGGQYRMRSPFYGINFVLNSPLNNIKNIKTPIMLWTGEKDNNVSPTQSIKFYNALWRLGKKSTLIIYPGEDHVLIGKDNQKDLQLRMKQWFGYYLKDEKPAEWIAKVIK